MTNQEFDNTEWGSVRRIFVGEIWYHLKSFNMFTKKILVNEFSVLIPHKNFIWIEAERIKKIEFNNGEKMNPTNEFIQLINDLSIEGIKNILNEYYNHGENDQDFATNFCSYEDEEYRAELLMLVENDEIDPIILILELDGE